MAALARLDVLSPTHSAPVEQVVTAAKTWLGQHNLQPVHRIGDGRHQLLWASHSLAPLWPDQPRSVSGLSLILEYAAHQIASLCPFYVEITAGLPRPGAAAGVVMIDLPWSDQQPLTGELSQQTQNTERLVAAYQSSQLAKFHQHYYTEKPRGPELWETTYDGIDRAQLPACVAVFLQKNYAPLRSWPGLQHMTRGLLGLGWHPRHIAGLVWSRWARDCAEHFADPRAQADHAVRCCSGQIDQQLDRLRNFDCEAVQATGFCPPNPCCPVDLTTVGLHLEDGSWHPPAKEARP